MKLQSQGTRRITNRRNGQTINALIVRISTEMHYNALVAVSTMFAASLSVTIPAN